MPGTPPRPVLPRTRLLVLLALLVLAGLLAYWLRGTAADRTAPPAATAPERAARPEPSAPAARAREIALPSPARPPAPETDEGTLSEEERALRREASRPWGQQAPPPSLDAPKLDRGEGIGRRGEASPSFKRERTEAMIGHQEDRLRRTKERLSKALRAGDTILARRLRAIVARLEARIEKLRETHARLAARAAARRAAASETSAGAPPTGRTEEAPPSHPQE